MATTTPTTTERTTSTGAGASTGAVEPMDRVVGVATVVGPLLMLASSVAWLFDALELRAILLLWAVIGFGLLLVGFAMRLRHAAPVGAAVILALGVIAACAGAGYAVEAAIVEHFGIERLNEQQTAATVLMLQLPGLLFPVSMLAAAVVAWRNRMLAPGLAGAFALGAVAFPASRVPELAGVAMVGDSLLCIALVPVGVAILRGSAPAATPSATVTGQR